MGGIKKRTYLFPIGLLIFHISKYQKWLSYKDKLLLIVWLHWILFHLILRQSLLYPRLSLNLYILISLPQKCWITASVTTYDLGGAAGDSGGSHLGPHACWTRTVPTEPYSQFLIFKVRIQTYRFPRGIFTNVCIHSLFLEFLPTSRWLSFFSQFSSLYTRSLLRLLFPLQLRYLLSCLWFW